MMEYVGRKVKKEACSGAVEAYSPATGLFKVVYDGGDSEEMELAEVSQLLVPPLSLGEESSIGEGNPEISSGIPRDSGGNSAGFDLNICGEIDLNDDGDRREGGGLGGLHGLDLNEGVNYILHDELDEIPALKRTTIDLNLILNEEVEENSSSKTAMWFDLNVELKEDEFENDNQSGMEVGVVEDDDCTIVMAPPYVSGGGGRKSTTASDMELRRHILMASFPAQDYALFAAGVYAFPPKVELPPSSTSLDLGEASLLDFLSVYAFLRSFSVSLLISPFGIDDLAASLLSNDSTPLFDSIHLSLLTTLRRHLKSLSDEGCASASVCLRSLNWDFLDLITWPVFLVAYLLFHSPKHIPGVDLSEFEPLESEYYTMPASAKVAILQHLCDDVVESEAYRAEVSRRGFMAERQSWNSRYFSCKGKKDGGSNSSMAEECMNEFVDDGNGDECYLCKTDGNLICCDGCPAAFHARCVGVVSSLLPDGDWFCPECTIDRGKPYKLTKSIRGLELLGTDPHARLYYSCCDYLLVADSCEDEYSFLLYKGNDIPAVIAALETSSRLYDKIACALRKHWSLTHGVPNEANYLPYSGQFESRLPLTPSETNQDVALAERKAGENSAATAHSTNIEVLTSAHVSVVVDETARDRGMMGNQLVSSEGSAEVCQANTNTDTLKEGSSDDPTRSNEKSGEGKDQTTANDGGAIVPQKSQVINYVNLYEFARMSSVFSKELASKWSAEDATKSAEQIIGRQMRVISNKYGAFSWSNLRNLSLNTTKEKCGWCFSCKVPEAERDCLFIMSDSVRATENFTSEALGIRSRFNRKNHLIDVICHVIWIEDRLHGLLSGPWSNPHYSSSWRKNALEAAHIGYIKILLLQLESNLHRRAISADWTKSVDSAVTMGSASHIVRRSTTRVPPKPQSSRSKRKCSNQEIAPTPKDAEGVSLSWWRGGRASRKLFHWKILPRSLASKAARQGGCKKIEGVSYPDSGEYAKRMKCIAWKAAVEASKTVEQLALQVRQFDANIKWNAIGNINLVPEKEPRKPAKSFKNVVIRKRRHEGEVVKYLLDFGKSRLIPDVVVKNGSLVEDCSSKRKKYWLEESQVPLHLLKAFGEKRLARVSKKDVSGELHERSREMTEPAEKKKGFEYLFERAERLERSTCEHCNESVLISEAVSCQYCKGFFHRSHARESATSSTAEPLYTCHKCWDKEFVQTDSRNGLSELPKHKKASKAVKRSSSKQPVHSESEKRESPRLDVPMQHSDECDLMVALQSMGVKKRKRAKRGADPEKDWWNSVIKDFRREKHDDPEKDLWSIVDNGMRKKRRADINSSYWLNGLRFSRRMDDERLIQFRSKTLLVLPGEDAPINQNPKCGLCGELERAPSLNYVACEICGAWFHGDALDLSVDRIQNIIGFECYNCLGKRPPFCPHRRPTTGNDKDAVVPEDNGSS